MQELTFKNMSKNYGGTPALLGVTLALKPGRVHALMGENGAGKSTLIKLMAGVVAADSISVEKDGQFVPLQSPSDARNAGFRFIHQELNIVPQVTVAENILLGRAYPRRFGIAVDWPKLNAQAHSALDSLGATHIDVTAQAGDLSAGDKMLVKIAAALVSQDNENVELYVLDEPTAALTVDESEMLFAVIERLKSLGAAILYVSHRIDEVLRICDDVTVLRDGKHVVTKLISQTSKNDLIQSMTGRAVADTYPPRTNEMSQNVVASVSNVETANLSNLNFQLHAGEVLGVSGLSDAGQSELLQLFMGVERVTSGELTLDNGTQPRTTADAWDRKVAYIPRERRSESLMLNMPIRSNILLPHLGAFGITANKAAETRESARLGNKVGLKYDGPEQPVGQLSGGNQQKVVFARAIHGSPKLLLLDEPTRGVDVGAKYDIYLLVRELSAQGCAVILTSTDLPEILGMCDKILVLHAGSQAHLLERGTLSAAELLSHFYKADAAATTAQRINT